MTNANLTLFICEVLMALGAFTALTGLVIVLFSVDLQKNDAQAASGRPYILTGSRHVRTGLVLAVLGFLFIALSSFFELIIY